MSAAHSRGRRSAQPPSGRIGPAADAAPAAHGGATQPAASVLTREILAPATVVVLGAIMTILDATIVNVALPVLGADLHTSIPVIQWVPSIYLLAFASVIPLTGWIAGRFGAKPVWLASLGLFMAGSLLAGLSPSVGALIVFRAVQGVGGGMIMPLGQSILAQVAGPRRMGRVMSIVGVPMLLAPIFGPLIGGSLIDAASWRWIFFVNLPVGLLAIALAVRLLPAAGARSAQRLDVPGALLLPGGLALLLYGLAEAGQHAQWTAPAALGPMIAGAVLVALFTRHALRVPSPLIDLRLFRRRGFAAGAAVNFVLGTALFGAALLLPLYFEVVRGRSPLQTGLLLAPQGLGAAIAISLAGYLTDKVGARRVVPPGVLLALAGTAWYTQIGAHSPYWALVIPLILVGAGLGATITPAMAAAFQDLPPTAMGQATSALNVVQRVAGALGSALLAVVLQRATTARLPGFHGGIGQAAVLAAVSPHAAAALAGAFGASFAVALAITILALVPAVLLPAGLRPDDERMRKESSMTDSIQTFLDQWSASEHTGDTERLDALLTDEFAGIGPLGFTLSKQAWLARHRSRDLRYDSFGLTEVKARVHDRAAIVTARNDTRGRYQGHPIPEATRATLVLVSEDGTWRLAAIHMSFIAGTPGAPPIPGTASRPEAQPAQPHRSGGTR